MADSQTVEVPQTLEGWYVLHDFRRVDWPRWKALPAEERAVGEHRGIDVVAILAGDDGRPARAAIRRAVGARLHLGVAEQGPQRVARWIDDQSVPVPVSLEGELDAPRRAATPRYQRARRPAISRLGPRRYRQIRALLPLWQWSPPRQ